MLFRKGVIMWGRGSCYGVASSCSSFVDRDRRPERTGSGSGAESGIAQASRRSEPTNLAKYVRDRNALVALGKALFWDMQAGSDGRQACASCHFHAGADHRAQNQLSNPSDALPLNHLLTLDEFPFHALANLADNRSAVLQRYSGDCGLGEDCSGGLFVDIVPGSAADSGFDAGDIPAFSLGGVNMRQVGTRNTPDGDQRRFQFPKFLGRPGQQHLHRHDAVRRFGSGDERPGRQRRALAPEQVRIDNSSLASQAVGPPNNNVEMSYDGRDVAETEQEDAEPESPGQAASGPGR